MGLVSKKVLGHWKLQKKLQSAKAPRAKIIGQIYWPKVLDKLLSAKGDKHPKSA
jgi:hypothetical protein